MLVVGVDGCKAGWVAISLAPDFHGEVRVFPHFFALWEAFRQAASILVDIPIGLLDRGPGERRCDLEARKLLGWPRRSSVFRVPCRPAVYAATYDEAIRTNEELTGTRIFRATWNIVPKIRELDELLASVAGARQVVREVHPELCFWALQGGRPLGHSKKTAPGGAERFRVLASLCPSAPDMLAAFEPFRRHRVARDDLLDALAAAVTAYYGIEGLSVLPATPEADAHGLPMEMVFWLNTKWRPLPEKLQLEEGTRGRRPLWSADLAASRQIQTKPLPQLLKGGREGSLRGGRGDRLPRPSPQDNWQLTLS